MMIDLYDEFEERIENKGQPLKRDDLIEILKDLAKDDDYEVTHSLADLALVKYINDNEIEEAYDSVGKWYA